MAKKITKAKSKSKPKSDTKPRSTSGRAAAAGDQFNIFEQMGTKRIAKGKLTDLLEAAGKRTDKMKTMSGELGSMIATHVEHDFLHRKAFGWLRQLDKMEPEKLAEFFYHFNHYIDETGLLQRAASVKKLDFDGDGEDGKGNGDDDGQTDIVDQAAATAERETDKAAKGEDNVVTHPRSRKPFPGAIDTTTGKGVFEGAGAGAG